MLHERGIRNHLHLCGLAHLLLTHHSLGVVGAQAKKETKDTPLPPLSQRAFRPDDRTLLLFHFERNLDHDPGPRQPVLHGKLLAE